MVHCIALHCLFCLKCKTMKELGQTGQEISQSSKQAQFSLSQGPTVGPTCSHDLGIHLKCFGQGWDAQRSSVNAQTVRNPKKSNLVNCDWFYGFEGVRWFERLHSCPYKSHLTYQRSRLKAQRSSVHTQTVKNPRKSKTVNSQSKQWMVAILVEFGHHDQ